MITGVVAEFNPFHHGHKYLLSQIKGLKIIAMSGNFTQRGEPAIVDKWVRTQMALASGADLVVELPFSIAVQSADYFAKGAIDILERLGIDSLAFGTEGSVDYNGLAALYEDQKEAMEAYVHTLPNELSYPRKTQAMWQKFASVDFAGNTPNHILGLTYAKACSGKGITLFPVKRIGSGFHSVEKHKTHASATAIRKHRSDQHFVSQAMPESTLFLNSPKVTWADYFPLLRYQIVTHPDLTQLFQVNDEIANRIKVAIDKVQNVEELIAEVATKRYTKARIRRILIYILVQAQETSLPNGIHVLGFNALGQAHLKELANKEVLVTRIGKEPWDKLTQRADSIYRLGNSAIAEQTWGRFPIIHN